MFKYLVCDVGCRRCSSTVVVVCHEQCVCVPSFVPLWYLRSSSVSRLYVNNQCVVSQRLVATLVGCNLQLDSQIANCCLLCGGNYKVRTGAQFVGV